MEMSLSEALLWVPRRYVDYTEITPPHLLASRIGEKVNFGLTLTSSASSAGQGKISISGVDEAGSAHRLTAFGALRFSPWKNVARGDSIRVAAKVAEYNGSLYLNSPELIDRRHWGRVVAVYRGIPGKIASDAVGESVAEAFIAEHAMEDAVLAIREGFGGMPEDEIGSLCGIKVPLSRLLKAIHRPSSLEEGGRAQAAARRLAVAQIRHAARRSSTKPFSPASVIRIGSPHLAALLERLPFKPTDGVLSQMSAIEAIITGLAEPTPMDAVLSADVGVGKTLVYMVPSVAAQSQGKKVAILIPNGLLVAQVAGEFRAAFPDVPVVEVANGVKTKQVDWSANPVLIGTTALSKLAQSQGWVPDFLVVDEQQKTSRDQRENLLGTHTNLLECTATALPRTMALVTHGGKQLIQVAKNHAKKSIHTRVVGANDKAEMLTRIRQVVASGGKVAMIYPRVAGSGEGDKRSVDEAAASWERIFPGQVAALHGRMKADEKAAIMQAMKAGSKSVLVASTIIEIGVTIKDLRLLVVVEAERYGVSTLHQMRGRLVRHGGEGWCYLYSPREVEEESLERLRLLEKASDGFTLAEADLAMRGFGDLSDDSSEQSGRSISIFRDLRLMPKDFL